MTPGQAPEPLAELRHLQAFVAVAETRSMTAAARRLHLSQQAVSRTVSALERRVGSPLFDRAPRGLILTEAGEALVAPARRALGAAADAFAAAEGARRPSAARALRCDISSGGIETGALILRRLRSDEPSLPVHQSEVGVARGLELVAAGSLDAVLGLAIPHPPEIRVEAIRHEPVLVGMAAHHPLASHGDVPVRALGDVPLLLPAADAAGEWSDFICAHLEAAGVTPKRATVVTHGSVSAAEIVREGSCVVPTMRWTEPPADLVFRRLVDPPASMTWSLMWRDRAELTMPVRALLAAARAVARNRGWLTDEADV